MRHGVVALTSRPDTPAISLTGEALHDAVGTECPPTPEVGIAIGHRVRHEWFSWRLGLL
jgi:hypothetical protein